MKLKSIVLGAVAACVAISAAAADKTAGGKGPDETPPLGASIPGHVSRMTLGYSYFNRPGADMATHNADISGCIAQNVRVLASDEIYVRRLPERPLINEINDASHRGAQGAALENCMVVRGWRVVHLTDAEGADLAALSQADLAERLKPWIGATEPHGEIVRVWHNDALQPDIPRFFRPDHSNNGQLGLKAVTGQGLTQFQGGSPDAGGGEKLDPKWPKKPLKADEFGKAPEGSAIIVFRVKGESVKSGVGIVFLRVGPNPPALASLTDHAPDFVAVAPGLPGMKKEGGFSAAAVPAGQWRLALVGLSPTINLCMGSPSFALQPGEVVYIGAFDLSSGSLQPDLSLGDPKNWLAGQPAAETIRPAEYINGSVTPCTGTIVYALEFNGAPFEPGYHWGSRAGIAAP